MNMKKSFLALLCFVSCTAIAQQLQRPKLVVGIVIDQMRWDYLYRYYDRYSAGGFKRLMNRGFNCQNTFINYLPSFTAPGHASVYTGSVPSVHGIAANDWIDNNTGRYWYCTEDTSVSSIGGSYAAGRMSPRNMRSSTITDELRLATNFKSRVFGIAIKDRGSILPAGHLANGAYWFDDSTGNFISSSFYGKNLPPWLQAFNGKRLADSLMARDWELLHPANSYTNSIEDANAYEGKFAGESSSAFPHSAKGMKNRGYYGLRYFPGGNTITFQAAKACIKGEDLGGRTTTDFLCVSFSTTDYAGHQFGPNSVEMEDMFLRFDMELAAFLTYLDNRLGMGNYTIFLTADHGAAHNYRFLEDKKMPAGSCDLSATDLNKALKSRFGKDSLVKAITNYQVYFNNDRLVASGYTGKEIKQVAMEWLRKQKGVAYAIDMDDIANSPIPEPVKTMVVNGYNRGRSGSIQVVLDPAWYGGHYTTGTTHGTWNPYDTHIPLLLYGWGVPKGRTHRNVNMTDIAPTLAALLHIQMPNGCVGEAITEITD